MAAQCVRTLSFWRSCVTAAAKPAPACAIIQTALPGGRGAATLFFPHQAQGVKHTYKAVLTASTSTGQPRLDAYLRAAQAYIVAQLNRKSGVEAPAAVQRAQALLASRYFGAVHAQAALPRELQRQVTAAVVLLELFGRGRLRGMPACASMNRVV